jgi:hypothetical protein
VIIKGITPKKKSAPPRTMLKRDGALKPTFIFFKAMINTPEKKNSLPCEIQDSERMIRNKKRW